MINKIAIIFASKIHIRNWFESGVIDNIIDNSNFEFTFFCSNDLFSAAKNEFPNYRWRSIQLKESKRLHGIFTYCNLVEFRNCNKSFNFWYKRLWLSDYLFNIKNLSNKLYLSKFVLFPYWLIVRIPFHIRFIRINAMKIIVKIWSSKILKLPSDFESFDITILPSGGMETWLYSFIANLRKKKIKTIVQIDNWDNMTSKSTWPIKPDYLIVISEQTKDHSITYHHFDESRIWVCGSPRFESLTHLGSQFERKIQSTDFIKIVYLGGSLPHNEGNLLNDLVDLFQTSDIKIQLFYRPHPAALPRLLDAEISSFLPNITIDPNFKNLSRFSGWPKIDQYFVKPLIDCDFVISAPSSIILEVLKLKRNLIVDGSNDHIHRTTSFNVLRNLVHLEDMINFSSIKIMPTAFDIFSFIKDSFPKTNCEDFNEEQNNYLISNKDFTLELINRISESLQ